MKFPSRLILSASAALASALLLAGPAAAATSTAPPLGRTIASGESCWYNADTGKTACFETQKEMEEAIEASTGTTLVYPTAKEATQAAELSARGVAAPAATYVNAVFYWNSNFGGSSFTSTTSRSTMCKYHGYDFPNLGNWLGGWEDRIGSYRTYGNCKATLYSERNYIGATYGPSTYAPKLYAMDDRASSIRVHG